MANFVPTGPTVSARNAALITPSDTIDLAMPATKGIYVGGAGNIKVDLVEGGTAILFTGVGAGAILPIQAKRVYTLGSGTTATALIALW